MITAKYPFAEIRTALDASRLRGHGKILVNVV
jgi:hypothetical protein